MVKVYLEKMSKLATQVNNNLLFCKHENLFCAPYYSLTFFVLFFFPFLFFLDRYKDSMNNTITHSSKSN